MHNLQGIIKSANDFGLGFTFPGLVLVFLP